MSTRVQVRVPGIGIVSLIAPDTIVDRLRAGGELEVKRVTAHRGGIDIQFSDRLLTHRPNPAGGMRWSDFFEQLRGELLGGRAPSVQLSLSGALLDGVSRRWNAERLKAHAARRPGRPKRSDSWNDDREEIYALILRRRQNHGDTLREAIEVANTLDSKRFRRAFKSIDAATIYCKRHAKDNLE